MPRLSRSLTAAAAAALALGSVACLALYSTVRGAKIERVRLNEAPGRRISVGDHSLHLHCTGTGSPVVVLEAGLAGWSQDWSALQPRLAKSTRVCSYDRAGYGWSDEAPLPRTGRAAVEDLRALLDLAGESPERILVGHSLGGALVQIYARLYPREVRGVLLLDSLQSGQAQAMGQARHDAYDARLRGLTRSAARMSASGVILPGVGVSLIADRLPARARSSAMALGQRSAAFRSLRDEYAAVDTTLSELAQAPPTYGDNVAVIGTAAVKDFPPGWAEPGMRQLWVRQQQQLGREWGVVPQIVSNAGHYLQVERPALVAAAVEKQLRRVRAGDHVAGPAPAAARPGLAARDPDDPAPVEASQAW